MKNPNMNYISIFKGSQIYSDLLDSFNTNKKIEVDLNDNKLSKAIYYHLCKMKYAGWRHRINFKRLKKHSLSEYFQDILAFYLKAGLDSNYEIILEKKIKKTQPDIIIKKNGVYHFIIEVKTNIGWARPDNSKDEPYQDIKKRRRELTKNFQISENNIIYVFEEPANVNKNFQDKFWDKKENKPKNRCNDFPYSIIYPLFVNTDPYYWNHEKGLRKQEKYIELTDDLILRKAETNIVTRFEEILIKVTKGC